LEWLRSKGKDKTYNISNSLVEIARSTKQINIVKELTTFKIPINEKMNQLLAG
jgi:hypothetical protein